VTIRTDDWPERDRLDRFHAAHGGGGIRVEPLPDEPLRIDVTMLKVAGLGLVQGRRSPLHSAFADGSDRLMLSLGGPAIATQFGREVRLERGDAVALCGADHGTLTTLHAGKIATLEFPEGTLLPLLDDPKRRCARRIPGQAAALRLLRGYLSVARATGAVQDPRLSPTSVAQIRDLAALAVGASREAEEIATGRGVRAARLKAIKDDITARVARDQAIGDVAGRHQLSARYLRMLFESDRTTLTEFVREERLKRVRWMLMDPRFAARTIADLAYDVGFNDVSYFNRSYRRRFGCSPGDTRRRTES
jgi:AraC-like DNA-binding protein